jgi:hypothetical protein
LNGSCTNGVQNSKEIIFVVVWLFVGKVGIPGGKRVVLRIRVDRVEFDLLRLIGRSAASGAVSLEKWG